MANLLAPVVLFTYNRPIHTKQALDALCKNDLAKESILIIYQDGLKKGSSKQDEMEWQEVNQLFKTISGFKQIILRISKQNQGCDPSMINGITEVINEYEKIIVLEDDLIVSPLFLTYLNFCLKKFKNTNVGCINAFNYKIKDLPNFFFIKGANPMGWATWKEKWKLYCHNTSNLINELNSREDKIDFDFGSGLDLLHSHNENILNGGRDVIWSGSLFVHDQLCLWPSHSFVNHIGFDGTGTHSKVQSKNLKMNNAQFEIENLANTIDIKIIDRLDLKVNREALKKLRHFYFNLWNKPFTTKERIYNKYYLFKHFIKSMIKVWL